MLNGTMAPNNHPQGLTKTLTYNCPKCSNPVTFDYEVANKDIIWTVHKGQLIQFKDSTCEECNSQYVLPIKISTDVSIKIDGYMTKEEHDSMFT